MKLDIYPWQQTQWQQLQTIQQSGRLPHGILLTGKPGTGLSTFARQLAAAILCDAFGEHGIANVDNADWRLFRSANHPDYRLIEPEADAKQIKVEQVRELIGFLQYTSQYGRKKIAVIDPAEAMNHHTANGLLKTLEEPPADSLLLLVSHHPERLPITIRSRCQAITLHADTEQQSLKWLQQNLQQNPELAEQALRITGTPLAAKHFIESEQFALRAKLLDDLALLQRGEAEPITVAERWDSFGAETVADLLQGLYQDLAKLKLFSEQADVSNRDLIQNLRPLIKPLDLFALMDCSQRLVELKRHLASPTSFNTQALMEAFILYWQSLTLADHRN